MKQSNIDRTARLIAGRDLACEMLRARNTGSRRPGAAGGDHASIESQYRDKGRPQDNWVLPFIERLRERPELSEGFAAVVSDFLVDCGGTDVDLYEKLTPDEFGCEAT